jgi:glycosyltransferase involved in cell wall biosynthesis
MSKSLDERKTIAIVGPFSFPEGGAAARRILGLSLSLHAAGYDIAIGSGQLKPNPEKNNFLTVISLDERRFEHFPAIVKHLMYIFTAGKNTLAWLRGLNQKPEIVILYSGYSPYLLRLIPWCRKNQVDLIFDVVEWYQPSHMPGGGRFSPYRINIELAMRVLIKKLKKNIVISDYLYDFYGQRSKVFKLPPTLDIEMIVPRLEARGDDRLIISYTGQAGKKDILIDIIFAIAQINEESDRQFELHIAGIKEEQLERLLFRHFQSSSIPTFIRTFGILNHEEALDIVMNSDYSVLIRKPQRYAQAGFPTKVVESLAVGTPVLCNLTSDLPQYVHHNKEGIICEDDTVESIKEAFRQIIHISSEQHSAMRKNARNMAVQSFDFRLFIEPLKKFLES